MNLSFILLCFFAIIGSIRFGQFSTGYYTNQRFTAASYFESLVFWNKSNFGRWNYTLSCRPFGEKIRSYKLVNDEQEQFIDQTIEYFASGTIELDSIRNGERYYYVFELDKKQFDKPIEHTLLVIDAVNEEGSQRYYNTINLFNDKLEGKDDWSTLRFEGIIHDQLEKYDKMTIYIWNPNGEQMRIRKVNSRIDVYKN